MNKSKDNSYVITIISAMLALTVLILMFYFSGQDGSVSSAVSGKFTKLFTAAVRHLFPDGELKFKLLNHADFIVRKAAHVTLFASFTMFICAFIYSISHGKLKSSVLAVICCVIAAAADEYHQTFIDSRAGMPRDVMIDTAGGVLGICAFWIIYGIFKEIAKSKRKKKQKKS